MLVVAVSADGTRHVERGGVRDGRIETQGTWAFTQPPGAFPLVPRQSNEPCDALVVARDGLPHTAAACGSASVAPSLPQWVTPQLQPSLQCLLSHGFPAEAITHRRAEHVLSGFLRNPALRNLMNQDAAYAERRGQALAARILEDDDTTSDSDDLKLFDD